MAAIIKRKIEQNDDRMKASKQLQATVVGNLSMACTVEDRREEPVLYPTLGCDIQGFRAMGLSVQ